MTIAFAFWILMLLWLVLGIFCAWPTSAPGQPSARIYAPFGGQILLFVLLCLLGWHEFGPPIHP